MKRLAPLSALAALVIMAGCRDTAAPAPDSEAMLAEDIALSSAASVSGDIVGMPGGEVALIGLPGRIGGPPGAFDRPGCEYSAETGWHECAPAWPGQMGVRYAFAFFTADGTPQEAYDALTTASVSSRMSREGTWTMPRMVTTIQHQRETTLSGLEGTETRHVWNGTGSRDESSESAGDAPRRAHTLVSRDTITNVVRLLPAAQHRWPASGTIVHNVAMTQTVEDGRTVTRSHSRRVVVTFNGTSRVPMQVGERTFILDLETGRVARQR